MKSDWLVTGFFFGLLLVILYGAFLILSPFLKAITWAAILAVIFYPVHAALLKLFRGRASLASLTVVLLITLIVVLPGFRLVAFLTEEVIDLVKALRGLAGSDGLEVWKQQPWLQQLLRWWGMLGLELEHLQFEIKWREILIQGAQLSSAALVSQVTGVAQNVFLFFANFIIVLLTSFFFLRDGPEICSRLRRLVPMDPQHQERLFQNIVNAVVAVVHGCLLVAMIQGLLAGLAYWAVGVPYAILWGVVTAFAALLPLGGTTLITVPITIYMFLEGQIVQAVLLLIWSLGVVGTVDNILKPMFIGNRLKLPVLLLFFSLLGGLTVFGALGFVLGPVVFALLAALLDLYLEMYGVSKSDRSVLGIQREP